ncbi:MAG: 4-hydroxy-tetrahydrodipicolinate reductase [Polyangiaceae bacterium]
MSQGSTKRPRLGVVGASGKMGQSILRLARESGQFEIACEISEGDDLGVVERTRPEVVIDFSRPLGTLVLAPLAAKVGAGLVVGTTGLDATCDAALGEAAKKVPVFTATNMSVGVYVLGVLAARATKMLGSEFDVEIVEAHHKRKVDAPSGTALTLAKLVSEARGPDTVLRHGREGQICARNPHEIGMHAVRGGDVIGEHTVFFYGEGERLELSHKASNRDLFARGALRAASWLVTQKPGKYGMSDLLSGLV